jgi:hypothetical protein
VAIIREYSVETLTRVEDSEEIQRIAVTGHGSAGEGQRERSRVYRAYWQVCPTFAEEEAESIFA